MMERSWRISGNSGEVGEMSPASSVRMRAALSAASLASEKLRVREHAMMNTSWRCVVSIASRAGEFMPRIESQCFACRQKMLFPCSWLYEIPVNRFASTPTKLLYNLSRLSQPVNNAVPSSRCNFCPTPAGKAS